MECVLVRLGWRVKGGQEVQADGCGKEPQGVRGAVVDARDGSSPAEVRTARPPLPELPLKVEWYMVRFPLDKYATPPNCRHTCRQSW